MMTLSRIALVQWHLLARADLDIVGNGAILGENRSGKSTLIDLIQTVMSGGAASLYRYNRSAGEGSGRSERTLQSYCLGRLDEGVSLRDQTITHIALTFEDAEGDRPPVTLGLCVEATSRDNAVILGRYVAEGVRADSALFVEEVDGVARSAEWPVVKQRLEAACAAGGYELRRQTKARDFIREYMRLLFTKGQRSEPERFARAFVLALSFHHIPSVEAFVQTYLLEKNDIDIGELRASIQRYRQIQQDIHDLEDRLAALRELKMQADSFEDLLRREQIARSVEQLAQVIEAGGALFDNLRAHREAEDQRRRVEEDLDRCEAELALAKDLVVSLTAQIQAQGRGAEEAVLNSEMKLALKERAELLGRLQARFLRAARGVSLLDQRALLQPLRLGQLTSTLEAIQKQSDGRNPPDWPQDPAGMETLLSTAATIAAEKIDGVREERNSRIGAREGIRAELKEAKAQLGKSQQGAALLDPRTEALMAKLASVGMEPRAVCEAVSLTDESWRNAAEALLGRDREAVIVAPEHASRAVEILRAGREAFRGCRVVNTRKLQGSAREAAPGSLASVFTSEDGLAMAFVFQRAGSVRLAETQEELMAGPRAIMRDGAYNSGLVVEVLHPQGLKIGRAAAGLMQARLTDEIRDLTAILSKHDANVAFIDDVVRRLEDLSSLVEAADRLDNLVFSIADAEEKAEDRRRRLADLAANVDPELEQALAVARRRQEMAEGERLALVEQRGSLGQTLQDLQRRLESGEAQPGSRLCLALRWRTFRQRLPGREAFIPVRQAYAALRAGRRPEKIARDQAAEAETLVAQYREVESALRVDLGRFRVKFGSASVPEPQARIIAEIMPWLEEGIALLERNQLIQYREQADRAAEEVSHLFRTSFVHELNGRFSGLRSEMLALNAALQSRPLHGEVYSVHWEIKPAFDALYRLARDSESDEDVLAALFGRGEPRDEKHALALKEVERLMQDETLDFTIYQDYRNYYAFELRMKDVATGRQTSFDRRRGVASGAELQVPFYVIIGAALASIYHGRRVTPGVERGIGLAVFDEAFSKMDGSNQRILLDFYRDIGLQVVVAAPPEKRSVIFENLDSVIDVYRFGDAVTAESARIKPLVHETLRRANPRNRTDEDLIAEMATAPLPAE